MDSELVADRVAVVIVVKVERDVVVTVFVTVMVFAPPTATKRLAAISSPAITIAEAMTVNSVRLRILFEHFESPISLIHLSELKISLVTAPDSFWVGRCYTHTMPALGISP
jgi:hypothetical protein